MSPQVEQLLGVSPERYTDVWVDLIRPDDRERVLASSAAADDAGTRFVAEYRSYRADGALVWIREEANYVAFDEGGGPTLSQGVMYDITARKEADARAFTAERQFQTLVERVPAIAYVWDAANAPGVVPATYISPQIEHVLGYDAADWMNDASAWHVRTTPPACSQRGAPLSWRANLSSTNTGCAPPTDRGAGSATRPTRSRRTREAASSIRA